MTYANNVTLIGGSTQINASTTGVEIDNSRRLVYLQDCSYARMSYGGGGLGSCAIGASYSLDGGTTWQTLLPPGPTLGLAGTILQSDWVDVSQLAWSGDVLVNAMAYGASLLGGLSYAVRFVELQVR